MMSMAKTGLVSTSDARSQSAVRHDHAIFGYVYGVKNSRVPGKVFPIISEVCNASQYRLNPNWMRFFLSTEGRMKDNVLYYAHLENASLMAHLIETILAIVDAASLRRHS